ncbi:MAG: (Na+)-NQR maturation NqrM [Zoogloeaceae bacterium]|nr:(Na+)-NQR maturation NqrM [Zoogloeaceae bacterium]
MITFLVTFGIILFLVFIMAIGVMMGRKPIAGRCGGHEALRGECAAGCRNPCVKRRVARAGAKLKALYASSGTEKNPPE